MLAPRALHRGELSLSFSSHVFSPSFVPLTWGALPSFLFLFSFALQQIAAFFPVDHGSDVVRVKGLKSVSRLPFSIEMVMTRSFSSPFLFFSF